MLIRWTARPLDFVWRPPLKHDSLDGGTHYAQRGNLMAEYPRSEQVQAILEAAHAESSHLRHEYLGTEHLLLGLLGCQRAVALDILVALGVPVDQVRENVLRTVVPGAAMGRAETDLPFTTRAQAVIALTLTAARELGHDYVGSEDLLLGLAREEHGLAALVLALHGASLPRLRAEVERFATGGRREPRFGDG